MKNQSAFFSTVALLVATWFSMVRAKDTRVFWIIDGSQTAIHRFNVTNVGKADETWMETLMTFSATMVENVIPAHGGYYLCKGMARCSSSADR